MDEAKLAAFLRELTALSEKYGLIVVGTGDGARVVEFGYDPPPFDREMRCYYTGPDGRYCAMKSGYIVAPMHYMNWLSNDAKVTEEETAGT